MSLLVLAYPSLEEADHQRIQDIRARHDTERYHYLNPHFTLVFPAQGWRPESFIDHIHQQTSDSQTIQFVLRSALVVKDPFSDFFNTFLVPDEGFGAIVRLHDRLYRGQLKDQLRIDIAYIPHISVGKSFDPWDSQKLADTINQSDVPIAGTIDILDVVMFQNRTPRTIAQMKLL